LPAQQGSTPQIGVVTPTGMAVPAASQQQHPLQSVQLASCESAWQLHDEAASPVVAASVVDPPASVVPLLLPLDEVVEPLLLPLDEVVEPLLLPLDEVVVPLLLPLLDAVASSAEPSSPVEPGLVLLLLQAASPTVVDAPITTMT
jgi:hypothetical protein